MSLIRYLLFYVPHMIFSVQVLEAQRRHQKEKSGIIPTSPTPYTYNKVRHRSLLCSYLANVFFLFGFLQSSPLKAYVIFFLKSVVSLHSLLGPFLSFQSCDLWSLGVIIYVMLCGYPPFYSKHHSRTIPKDMRKKIMTGSFDFPEDEWSQISEMAKDIVRKYVFPFSPFGMCLHCDS